MTNEQHAVLKAAAEASGTSMGGIITNYIDNVLTPSTPDALLSIGSLVNARASYANSILASTNTATTELTEVQKMVARMSGEDV